MLKKIRNGGLLFMKVLGLEKNSKNKPIKYYTDIYDDVRAKTKKLLKTKDDNWFKTKIGNMSMHWAWSHVMGHQANHIGLLALITKRIN
jgi:hypothetical protein